MNEEDLTYDQLREVMLTGEPTTVETRRPGEHITEAVKPKIVLFDMDSTLSDSSERYKRLVSDYDTADWHAYAMSAGEDPPTQTLALALLLQQHYALGIVSFRVSDAISVTQSWLYNLGVKPSLICLASASDDDTVAFKLRAVAEIQKHWDIVLFVEDQHRVAKAVQEQLGVPCMVVSSYPPEDRELSF